MLLTMTTMSKTASARDRFSFGGAALLLWLVLLGPAISCAGDENKTEPDTTTSIEQRYTRQRQTMVRSQIRGRGVSDTLVLHAMATVPRHRFVPEEWRRYAYDDTPLPIGNDQTISQPYVVAFMTELLEPQGKTRVLEIGTGSGYQAAVLAEIVDSVFSIEIVPNLARRAAAILDSLEYDNVLVREGDGYRGWPEHAPFDAIIVTCAPDNIPTPLVEQLRDGGTMVIPIGGESYQELALLKKVDGRVQRESVAPVRFVPMTGEAQKRKGEK